MLTRLLGDRLSIASLSIILLIRIGQLFSFDVGNAENDLLNITTYYYYSLTSIAFGVFVLVPLFMMWILSAVRVFEKASFCSRLKTREGSVYYFALLALVKAVVFSIAINVSAAVILLIKHPISISTEDVMTLTLVTTVLETLFFLACALLLFSVFSLSRKIHYAAITVLCYAAWDYVASHIPYYAFLLPRFGWQLTEVTLPLAIQETILKALPLLAILAFVAFISLVAVRRNDIMEARNAESAT